MTTDWYSLFSFDTYFRSSPYLLSRSRLVLTILFPLNFHHRAFSRGLKSSKCSNHYLKYTQGVIPLVSIQDACVLVLVFEYIYTTLYHGCGAFRRVLNPKPIPFSLAAAMWVIRRCVWQFALCFVIYLSSTKKHFKFNNSLISLNFYIYLNLVNEYRNNCCVVN